ncbi:acyltransferase family protein [Enterobacter hormaechei]
MMSNDKNSKVLSVEGVRGFACLMVVLSHLSIIFFPYLHTGDTRIIKSSFDSVLRDIPVGFIYSGTAAVYIFFALSGYILCSVILRSEDCVYKSAKMLTERYVRLVIPVSASIALCAIVVTFFPFSKYWVPWIWSLGRDGDLSVIGVIKNALYGAILFGDTSINMVTWTMRVEFFGSLLVFLITPVAVRVKYSAAIISIAGLLIVINTNDKNAYGYAAFLFGMSTALSRECKNRSIGYLIAFSSLYMAGFKYNSYLYVWFKDFAAAIPFVGNLNFYLLFNLLAGVGLVYSFCKIGVFTSFSESRVMVLLGKLSFSAYLIQMPVFYCVSGPIYHASRIFMSDASSCLAAFLLSVIVLYAISYVFYVIIDKKSISISHKFAFMFVK